MRKVQTAFKILHFGYLDYNYPTLKVVFIPEIWKPIRDYEGWYEVSNTGRVRSVKRNIAFSNGYTREFPSVVKIPNINKGGYYSVLLKKNRKEKRIDIHRLVACAFLPNLENKLEVNHKDGNKANNIVSNLEHCTRHENVMHAIRTGLVNQVRGSDIGLAKLTEKQVACIRNLLRQNAKIKCISYIYNISTRTLYDIKNNKIWRHVTV